jgi:hypothetical protein
LRASRHQQVHCGILNAGHMPERPGDGVI